MSDKLTAKQEKFAVLCFEGNMSNTECFLSVYPFAKKWKRKTVHENASRMFNKSKVAARIQELRDQAVTAAIVTRSESLMRLSAIIRNNRVVTIIVQDEEGTVVSQKDVEFPAKDNDIIKSIERISKMQGWEAAKVVAFDSNNTDPMSRLLGLLGEGTK
ncbi:MAG: hypothetical protein KAU20_03470 [Nanoarchaeota archaeon]|nr:hypothetical protein [Nanoarchaeota archaeon]